MPCNYLCFDSSGDGSGGVCMGHWRSHLGRITWLCYRRGSYNGTMFYGCGHSAVPQAVLALGYRAVAFRTAYSWGTGASKRSNINHRIRLNRNTTRSSQPDFDAARRRSIGPIPSHILDGDSTEPICI